MTDGMFARHHTADVDAEAAASLAAQGLDLRRLDDDDAAAMDGYLQSVARGFHDGEQSEEQRTATRERSGYRRKVAVYDPAGAMPEMPVATFATWIADLSLPGGRTVPSCAVSAVTVAPTHHRRGIARALMEGELRVAAAVGAPVAMLTASEAQLYGRYGFAAAAHVASWKIEARRAGWIGPEPAGRIDFIDRETYRRVGPEVHERMRRGRPGELPIPGSHWDAFAGTRPDAKDAGTTRVAQYRDVDGVVQGTVAYRIRDNDEDFTKATAEIAHLYTATDDAYAALWRFMLGLDLVGTVTADLRSVDEPLRWMLADPRAATVTVRDHQYVRILDVARALGARTGETERTLLVHVTDPLGIDGGTYLVQTAPGVATRVTPDPAPRPDAPVLTLDTTALSALFLGGVGARTLQAAGRIQTTDPDVVDDVFRSRTTPSLSFWY